MTFRVAKFKFTTILFLLIGPASIEGQKLEVLERSSYNSEVLTDRIFPMDPTIDSASVFYAATIKVTATPEKSDPVELFQKIKYKAKGIGASGYKISDYEAETDSTPASITMKLYAYNDSLNKNLEESLEKNVVYVLGGIGNNEKPYEVFIDRFLQVIEPNKFYRLRVKEEETLLIRKKGKFGQFQVRPYPNRPALFVSNQNARNNVVLTSVAPLGFSFVMSKGFNQIDAEIGYFLLELMKHNN
jgi:hypothetical protein